MFRGNVILAIPVQAIGLTIQCDLPPDATALGMIYRATVLEHMAVDRELFWATWRRLGGGDQRLVWEDGEPFIPRCAGVTNQPIPIKRPWSIRGLLCDAVAFLRWLLDVLLPRDRD